MELKDLSLADLVALEQQLINEAKYFQRNIKNSQAERAMLKLNIVKLEINRKINLIKF
jgi:hypothetical protein